MPLLAAFFGSLFGGLVDFLTKFLTKRVAIVLAGITLLTSLTAALVTAIQTLLDSVSVGVPAYIQAGASWIMPDNFPACVAAVISAKLLRWVYDWNTRVIQWKLL